YIYDLFVQAVLFDMKTLKPEEIAGRLIKEIAAEVPCIINHTKYNEEVVDIYLEVAIAIVKTIIFTFKETFMAFGLNVISGSDKKGQLTLTLMTKDSVAKAVDQTDIGSPSSDIQVKALDLLKLEFMEDVFKEICGPIGMIYGYTEKDGKLIFVLTLQKK
nr:hypothetical protein [Vallitaleaceae bacterium]